MEEVSLWLQGTRRCS